MVTEVDDRNQIAQLFGFQEVQNLDTYLGVPLLYERVTNNTLSFVVDKVRRKLQNWDVRKLSLAGRTTLAQWKDQVLDSISRNHCSHLWKPLSMIWSTFRENLFWSLGDGSTVRCWKDPWILERVRRGIGHSIFCTLFGHAVEDLVHVLRDCPIANDVWNLVLLDQLKQRDSGYAATGGMFEAKVWSILNGILILLNKGYRRATILSDNLEVAHALMDMNLEDSRITVLRRIQRIIKAEGIWRIKHIPRCQNLVAYC
ncbi:hypothetical protein J1N35_025058 [Gossypium stocksii]|uniref:RNase H type-1 domain-containing protein n=1 Tax=Gossypium stocksii TaxID=47602 RepID=A0A9D3V5V6_9ROSI|nr:hypothetical protein J1N35_025058 [Gossypium stocksii]